ncbi:hypothetical protein LRY60_04580 [Candidatus Woesebacteria bacterium]|nr:hypothetical protein [Candidatus Woesebacteria bacterium]MCD8546739.1 hypothetical protein [Candidatus Woesebacteria bacterium]
MPARIPDTERQQILARLQSEITYDRLIDDPVVREIQQLSEDHWRKYSLQLDGKDESSLYDFFFGEGNDDLKDGMVIPFLIHSYPDIVVKILDSYTINLNQDEWNTLLAFYTPEYQSSRLNMWFDISVRKLVGLYETITASANRVRSLQEHDYVLNEFRRDLVNIRGYLKTAQIHLDRGMTMSREIAKARAGIQQLTQDMQEFVAEKL